MDARSNRYRLLQAALFVLIGAFCFSVMNAIAKFLPTLEAEPVHVFQLTMARYAVAVVCLLPFWFFATERNLPSVPLRYFVRTACSFGGIALMFLAVSTMQLATATAIGFTSPIFAMIIAALFLREKVGGIAISSAALGLISTMVIIGPGGFSLSSGALIALAAAASMGGEIVAIKWLSKSNDNNLTILLFSNACGFAMALFVAAPVWITPDVDQAFLLFGIGAVAAFGQVFILQAARQSDANFLAPFFYVSLIYAAVIGFFVFGEIPDLMTTIGCIGILCSALLLTFKGTSE